MQGIVVGFALRLPGQRPWSGRSSRRHCGAGVQVEPEVRSGHAAHELIAAGEGAELLVVGTRGRGGFATLLLGVDDAPGRRHAGRPVVVVRSE